jgi:hypothetical protein
MVPEPVKDFTEWLEVNRQIDWLTEWENIVANAVDYTPDYKFPLQKQSLTITGGLRL